MSLVAEWAVALKLREIMGGILQAEAALQEAKEAEAGGTISAVSYAHIDAEVDGLSRMIIIRTGNHFFAGDRDEVRRGRLGEWTIVWERDDVGITTGEDFLPPEIRGWLLRHTRADGADAEQEGGEEYYEDDHYWDIYPW